MKVNSTRLLWVVQQFRRYYDRQFTDLLARSGLTMREMDVILFLTNNPGHDTARDVTELRGLSKSQVSAAVDLLAERGLLDRLPDRADRRVVPLALTEAGAALARQGRQIQSACLEKLFSGLTPAETDRFQQLLEKVLTGAETQLREGANT